ncbi:START domain containing protein [Diplonema papillatum]|nr:START domain containing protein [Diplonema papillatum]
MSGSETESPRQPKTNPWNIPPAKKPFHANDTEEVELDVGCGLKRYRWSFDGREFQWECFDEGRWYQLISKKIFRKVLKVLRSEDGRSWGTPAEPREGVKVYRRPPTEPQARIDEIRVDAILPNISAEALYNTLHEHAYRSTWDSHMLRGFNIARFALNNDIGYYEAKVHMLISNRDLVNQRGWLEMGNNQFMIVNWSMPHAKMPEKSGAVRARSFLTAYYIRPSHDNPIDSSVSYMTCADPNGAIPASLINLLATKTGPGSLVALAAAAAKLGPWLDKMWAEHLKTNGPVKGPWDKTFERPGQFIPRDPKTKGDYRVQEMPLDLEKKQVEALDAEYDESSKKLMEEEVTASNVLYEQLSMESSGCAPSHAPTPARHNNAGNSQNETPPLTKKASFGGSRVTVSEVRELFEPTSSLLPDTPLTPGGQKIRRDSKQRLEDVERAVQSIELENRKLRERLAVFSRTGGADPLTRVPADEPAVCSEFRKYVAHVTEAVAVELEDGQKIDQVSLEDYLCLVLTKLEVNYPVPEEAGYRCPVGHGAISYDELWKFIEYNEKPTFIDVWLLKIAYLALIISTVVNGVIIVHLFLKDLWHLGVIAVTFVVLGDFCLWWCLRDIHYKDRPFTVGGKPIPLLWPTRLQIIPVLPCMALALLLRVPGEMAKPESPPTHVNIIYRFSFLYAFMRALLHTGPLMYFLVVAQYKADTYRGEPLMGDLLWTIMTVSNLTFLLLVLLWIARLFFGVPTATTTRHNMCGLPPFSRAFYTSAGALLVLMTFAGISIPILFDSKTYPS